jgi:hypothetical protein
MPRSRRSGTARPRGFNSPPEGQAWWWFTVDMMEHPSFGVLTRAAYQVLFRICIEHAHHHNEDNGRLPITYDDFVKYGVHRHRIRPAILELEALGFIKCKPGRAGNAQHRTPSHYTLTFRPTLLPAVQVMTPEERARFDAANSTRRYGQEEPSTAPATNEWKGRAKTIKEAQAIVDQIRGRRARSRNHSPVTVSAPTPVAESVTGTRDSPVAVSVTTGRAETATTLYTLQGAGGRAALGGGDLGSSRPRCVPRADPAHSSHRSNRSNGDGRRDNGGEGRQQQDNGEEGRQQRDDEWTT